MRSVIEFLVQFILAITGAVGTAILIVAGIGLLTGCGVLGGGWCYRAWRQRNRR